MAKGGRSLDRLLLAQASGIVTRVLLWRGGGGAHALEVQDCSPYLVLFGPFHRYSDLSSCRSSSNLHYIFCLVWDSSQIVLTQCLLSSCVSLNQQRMWGLLATIPTYRFQSGIRDKERRSVGFWTIFTCVKWHVKEVIKWVLIIIYRFKSPVIYVHNLQQAVTDQCSFYYYCNWEY